MTKETILKRAHNYYDNCELIIKELCEYTVDFEEPLDVDAAITELDIMMLAILYAQAIADGDFCEAEKEFIMSFPNADNFFLFFHTPEFGELTWQKAFELSKEDQAKLSETLNELLNNTANDFIFKFALLDSLVTKCYISELTLNLGQIALLMSMVDGETTADELVAFQTYVEELIIGKWTYYSNAMEEAMDEALDEAFDEAYPEEDSDFDETVE